MTDLEKMVLEALSFYEGMTIEKVLMNFDKDKIESLQELEIDNLKELLDKLVSEKRLKKYKKDGRFFYLRKVPKRGLISRLITFFSR